MCHTSTAYLVYSEVLGRGVALPAALACCMTAAGVIALLTLLRALSLVLALVPNTVGDEGRRRDGRGWIGSALFRVLFY